VSILRRLTAADEPQETRVFLLLGAFGLFIGVVYWLVSYEVAGTVLLLAFGAATALVALRLLIDPRSGEVRTRARARPAEPDPDDTDEGGGGAGGVDRPFLDEAGRFPSETLAPFAVGLGATAAATGLIFGPAPVLVGILPFLWGAWMWLAGAREELDAVEVDTADADAMLFGRNEHASRDTGDPAKADPARPVR
jgi:uncharacterized membrane protein YfcA